MVERRKSRRKASCWPGCCRVFRVAEVEEMKTNNRINKWEGIYLSKCSRRFFFLILVQRLTKKPSCWCSSMVSSPQKVHGWLVLVYSFVCMRSNISWSQKGMFWVLSMPGGCSEWRNYLSKMCGGCKIKNWSLWNTILCFWWDQESVYSFSL